MRRILPFFAVTVLICAAVLSAGCTSGDQGSSSHSASAAYSFGDDGRIIPGDIGYRFGFEIMSESDGVTVSRVVMNDGMTNVYAVLSAPENPKAAVVFAPGAGETAEACIPRSLEYAGEGIAFMTVDIRGSGGMTAGVPLDFSYEYQTFAVGLTPQYYSIVFDLIAAKNYLKSIYGAEFPVYIIGSSNGGRYACMAAEADADFAGYIGVSTSGYDYVNGINGEIADFFFSTINPYNYIPHISPRPVLIMHSETDDIIDVSYGRALYEHAAEPKEFTLFNGTHGLNSEANAYICEYILR